MFFGYGRRDGGPRRHADRARRSSSTPFLLRTSDAPWFGAGLEISKTGERYLLATTQDHHAMEGRAPARVATLDEYTHDPESIQHMDHTPPKTLTLYPDTSTTATSGAWRST